MKRDDAFPSKWLKAGDIGKRRVKATIDSVAWEKVGDENRAVMYFRGKDKGYVMNATNWDTCEAAFGDESDDWAGAVVTIGTHMTRYKGKPVLGILLTADASGRPEPNAGPHDEEPSLEDEPPF